MRQDLLSLIDDQEVVFGPRRHLGDAVEANAETMHPSTLVEVAVDMQTLAELTDQPSPLQEGIFSELFNVAEITNFSRSEQDGYQNSLKYYRDMNNVVNTSRQEGRLKERSIILDRQRDQLFRLLPRRVGELSSEIVTKINGLSLEQVETLGEISWDFVELNDLVIWFESFA